MYLNGMGGAFNFNRIENQELDLLLYVKKNKKYMCGHHYIQAPSQDLVRNEQSDNRVFRSKKQWSRARQVL